MTNQDNARLIAEGKCPYCGSFEGVDDPPLMAYGACYSCAPKVKPDTSEEKAAAEIEAYWQAVGENPTEPISTCDEDTQPVEAIPTDSRYTCPVCGGAMVEMPPVPDGIDDPSWHLAYCEFMFTEPQTCRYAWSWHDDDGDDTLVLEA